MGGLGLSPPDALQSPAVVPVCVLGPDDEIGGIERGSVGGRDRGAGSIAPRDHPGHGGCAVRDAGREVAEGSMRRPCVSLLCPHTASNQSCLLVRRRWFSSSERRRRVQAFHLLMPSNTSPLFGARTIKPSERMQTLQCKVHNPTSLLAVPTHSRCPTLWLGLRSPAAVASKPSGW